MSIVFQNKCRKTGAKYFGEGRMTKRSGVTVDSSAVLKKLLCPLLVVVFSFVLLFGFGKTSVVEGQNTAKASGALLHKAQAADKVRIIVKLNASFQPEGRLSGAQAVASQQSRISGMQNQLHQALAKHHVQGVKKFKHIPYTAMEVDATALSALLANPLVASIEEDVPVPPMLTESVPLIKADQAWNAGYTGAGWTVAIIDTGVDKTHSFIGADKVVAEACFSTTDSGVKTVCPNGLDSQIGSGAGINCGGQYGTGINGCQHGTHVAGIAAGKSETINGVAKDAKIIAIQVFSRFTGEECTSKGYPEPCALSFTSDQILALEHVYSLRNTYQIAAVNMSLGGGKYTSSCDSSESARKAAIDNLRSAGIATIISSGNEGYTDGIAAPACISTAVSVGATSKSDVEDYYSNYHPAMLSLFAPGSSIRSSIPGEAWDAWDGTSMAAPHVTGAWAILKQIWPSASVADLLLTFQSTGATVTTKAGDLAGGAIKRIDVKAALDNTFRPPSALSGVVLSANAVALTWTNNAASVTGFKIERKTGESGAYGQIATTGAGVTAYTDSSLSEGVFYAYRVRAYNAAGNSSYSNEAGVTTLLAAPSGLSALFASMTQFNLNWKDNSSHEQGFKIERKTGANGAYSQIGTTAAGITTYEDKNLTSGVTYYYRVRAYNAAGDSDYSNEAKSSYFFNVDTGGSSGCFVATAAFGSPLAGQVAILRQFRDRHLLTNHLGRKFVDWYYRNGPAAANYIADKPVAKAAVRAALYPLIGLSALLISGYLPFAAAGLGLLLLTLIFFRFRAKKSNEGHSLRD